MKVIAQQQLDQKLHRAGRPPTNRASGAQCHSETRSSKGMKFLAEKGWRFSLLLLQDNRKRFLEILSEPLMTRRGVIRLSRGPKRAVLVMHADREVTSGCQDSRPYRYLPSALSIWSVCHFAAGADDEYHQRRCA